MEKCVPLTEEHIAERRVHAEELPEHLVGRPEHKVAVGERIVAHAAVGGAARPMVRPVVGAVVPLVVVAEQAVLAVLVVDATLALCEWGTTTETVC